MAKPTKNEVEQVLTSKLGLEDAVFTLRKSGNRILGHIVSPTFRGWKHHDRQKRIWDVLESQWGADAFKMMGMFLTYTPEEWNFDEVEPCEEVSSKKKKRKTG
jgi:acid stress-induced BolA-like protein IbaG/YrbA